VIRDSAALREKLLHRDMAIMEEDGIINQPRRVTISEANSDACRKKHK
jgi:hypothetical protein